MKKTPVMILFFNRPDTLKQVFKAVCEYEPSDLFLVQDGPRNQNRDDIEKILKCRSIVENISWSCNVHKNYSSVNMSCDHREYTGIEWCFQYVDRLIILEDDCVPTKSFFVLCEECLERYKDNTEIHSIVGFNRIGVYDTPYDYIFSMTSAGLGWATWKRVWKKVNDIKDLEFFEDKKTINYLSKKIDPSIKRIYGDFVKYMKETRKDNIKNKKITSWEKLYGFTLLSNNMLTITPAKNMIKYIGISDDATHCVSDYRLLPHKVSKVLMQPAYLLDKEKIEHPQFIIRDTNFEKASSKSMRYIPFVKKIEIIIRKLLFGILLKGVGR